MDIRRPMTVVPLCLDLMLQVLDLMRLGAPYVHARTPSDYWLYSRLFATTCPLALVDEVVVAAVVALRSQDDPGEVYIQDVMTHPEHRRRGAATALIGAVRRRAGVGLPPAASTLRTGQHSGTRDVDVPRVHQRARRLHGWRRVSDGLVQGPGQGPGGLRTRVHPCRAKPSPALTKGGAGAGSTPVPCRVTGIASIPLCRPAGQRIGSEGRTGARRQPSMPGRRARQADHVIWPSSRSVSDCPWSIRCSLIFLAGSARSWPSASATIAPTEYAVVDGGRRRDRSPRQRGSVRPRGHILFDLVPDPRYVRARWGRA